MRSFARTAFEFTLHPTRFAKEWATGTRHALNPLGFLATAFAVLAPFDAVFAHLTHHDDSTSEPLLRAAAGAILPFGYYLLVGALQHGVLRLCGSRRPLHDCWCNILVANVVAMVGTVGGGGRDWTFGIAG